MAGALGSARYRGTVAKWKSFLEGPGEEDGLPGARRPIGDVAAERVWKVYRKVMKEGGAIDEASPPEDLHELRKSCKKLRYLLEFFRSLYPPGGMERLIGSLKGLQETLGDYQDLQVQSEALEEIALRMEKEKGASPRTYMAMGRLVEGLHGRSAKGRGRFEKCFTRFSSRRQRALFKKYFKREAGTPLKDVHDGKGNRTQVSRQQ
jgi:CHAD domain-containing protein